jgi:GxxExxY protein
MMVGEQRARRFTQMNSAQIDANDFLERELTGAIIGAYYRVYNYLGYGFLESVYRRALAHELRKLGLRVDLEVAIDVWYDGILVGHFRADLLVERRVLLETKASEFLSEADRSQLRNYLHGSDIEVGLLLHFGPKAHFERMVFSNSRKPARGGASTNP